MTLPYASRIQTVTEITRSIKGLLETGFAFVAVCGEVSNLKQPFSGHLYFTLKDHDAQLRAVLFKTQRRYLAEALRDGLKIICRGRISLYEPRGEYQLIVDSVEFAGEGGRLAAYAELKEKLYQEGLFAEGHKRALPFLPKGIALITSPRGAAVHDFLTTAARRSPTTPIEIHPVPVQGEGTVVEIIGAIRAACRRGHADVIVICRGGGSAEDLWPFNSEELARTVYQATIPIVSAIGHEVDFTILDFVADLRVPTPTAAAEAVLPDRDQLRADIQLHRQRQQAMLARTIAHFRQRLDLQHRLLGDPARAIQSFRMRIDYLLARLRRSIDRQLADTLQQLASQRSILTRHNPEHVLNRHLAALTATRQRLVDLTCLQVERKRAALERCTAVLGSVSPRAVLERGYAIVRKVPGGEVVRSKNEVAGGTRLAIGLRDGDVLCEVLAEGPK